MPDGRGADGYSALTWKTKNVIIFATNILKTGGKYGNIYIDYICPSESTQERKWE